MRVPWPPPCLYRAFHTGSRLSQQRDKSIHSPLARRLFNLPPTPTPPTQNHHDLSSFLSYAARISLSETSTTYIGTHYEYTVQETLRRYSFSLHRVGGRADAGIDLAGTWHVPPPRIGSQRHRRAQHPPLRVVAQCKALRAKLGPNLVRELEGAFRYSLPGFRTEWKLGMLVSPREATKGVRDALARSPFPLMWMMMDRGGSIAQVLWNARVEDNLGLRPLCVEKRYRLPSADGEGKDARPTQEVVLTWDGQELPHMDLVEEDMARREKEWSATWGGQEMTETEREEMLSLVQDASPGVALENINPQELQAKKGEFLSVLQRRKAGSEHMSS
ncbi:hypothetical protein VTN31DRAFT_6548 [Thermomyces dupontii]|uniref:uncharacterized protein n=1 Tax=Talaromyces thermophilus TaxID=28565 RepID=UPI0037428F68